MLYKKQLFHYFNNFDVKLKQQNVFLQHISTDGKREIALVAFL